MLSVSFAHTGSAELNSLVASVTFHAPTVILYVSADFRIIVFTGAFLENFRREKLLLTEQVIELKKMKEVADREIALKDSEIVSLRQDLERTATELRHERHSRNLVQAQVRYACLKAIRCVICYND